MPQKTKYFTPSDYTGSTHTEHVRRLEATQRHLLAIENEPIACSKKEFFNPDDAFLLN